MWYIIKYKKNSLNEVRLDIKKKLGCSPKIFVPKIRCNYVVRNKIVQKSVKLLGNYALCFHEKFNDSKTVELLKFTRGLDFFLSNSKYSQEELKNFVLKCESHLDSDGFLESSFFNYIIGKTYKFITGPFSKMSFKIVHIGKNKFEILLGNFRTTVLKEGNFFQAV